MTVSALPLPSGFVYENVQRFSFGGAAALGGPRGFRSRHPRR
jgi:hypothetical protein